MATTPEQYYADPSLHGNYQYITLADIINTFLVRYVGDNEEINNVARHRVIFEAKRGLKELNYDVLKEVKVFEIDLDENFEVVLPHDYVNYVRISWVDDNGNLRPMLENTQTGIVSAYLQDNNYQILFDDEGCVLTGTSNTELNQENVNAESVNQYLLSGEPNVYNGYLENSPARYNLNTETANMNGGFVFGDGKIRFGRDIPKRTVVIEYISDGLEKNCTEHDIRVHKFAERALYAFIKYEILNNRLDSTEYRINRAKKDWLRERMNAKLRLSNLKPSQLIQRLRGRQNWLK